MRYSIIQKELAVPPVDALKRAFRTVSCLTDIDAFTLARDAYGILVKNLSAQDAATLQGALRVEGIETDLVEDHALPQLPPAKQVTRLDCQEDHLLIYDPIGRSFPLSWANVMLVAAGQVNLTEFQRNTIRQPINRYTADGQAYQDEDVDYVTREIRADRLLLEVVVSRAVLRYSAQAEKFNYQGLGNRRSKVAAANYRMLVQDIAARASQATMNRGAYHLREQSEEIFSYPTKNAFYEEMVWLLWRMRQTGVEP